MTPAISIRGLGKSYRITHEERGGYRTLRESMADMATAPLRWARKRRGGGPTGAGVEEFWAVKDLSFDIKPGEVVGVIGHNGAGKSTLLKIISRITKPTVGEIVMRGRVGSLLEVGTGFHPELTGRENIYLNGAILGMTKGEIARKFDEIVDFSDVEKFLDTPVKRYSSGMYVRLAFAVAAHLEPEILLVDEVLAVGDQAFQKKCIGKMGDIAASGRTVLLVSHNLPMVSKLATSAVWLNGGRLEQEGAPMDVIGAYVGHVASTGAQSATVDLTDHPGRRRGSQKMLRRIALSDGRTGASASSIPLGGSLVIELEADRLMRRPGLCIGIDLCDPFGTVIAHAHSQIQSSLDLSELSSGLVRCTVDDVRLLPGNYYITAGVGDSEEYLDKIERAAEFTVTPEDIYGTGRLPHRNKGLLALDARFDLAPAGADTPVAAGSAQPR